jgi:quercetin dioxygenase-like cupin family protein
VDGERMTCIVYRFEPNAIFPLHHHPQEQLCLLRSGSLTCTAGDETVSLSGDHPYIIPENLPHSIRSGPEGAELLCVLSPRRTPETSYRIVETS